MNEFDSMRVDQIFESGNRIASKCLVSAGCQSSATLTCDVIVFFFFSLLALSKRAKFCDCGSFGTQSYFVEH